MRKKQALFFFYLLFISCMAIGQPENGLPFIRNYDFKAYNSHPQNWTIFQDQRGVMYFGNGDGILEYDGINWRLIGLPEGESVYALASDRSGRIFVGGDKEFGYLAPDAGGALHYVSLARQFADEIPSFVTINKVFTTDEGVYFCSDEFVLRWSGNDEIKMWYPKNESSFGVFHCNDQLYIQEGGLGIMHLKEDIPELLPGTEIVAYNYILAILPYNDNEILIATYENGLFLYNHSAKNTRKLITDADPFLIENRISAACLLSDGYIALGTTTGGIVVIDKRGNHIETINQESGLQNVICHFLYQDRQGLLWAALDYGISSIDLQGPVRYWNEPSGMKNTVMTVLRHKNVLYTGTDMGVYFINDKKLQQTKGALQGCSTLLHFSDYPDDPSEQLLAGASEGIYKVEQDRSELIMRMNTYKMASVPGDASRILVGADEGCYILQYSDKKWVGINKIKGVNDAVQHIFNDEKGDIWLGLEYDGIKKVILDENNTPARIVHYDSLKGLPDAIEKYPLLFNNTIMVASSSGIYTYNEEIDRFFPDSVLGKKYTAEPTIVYHAKQGLHDDLWLAVFYDNQRRSRIEMAVKQKNNQYKFNSIPFKRLPNMIVHDFYPEKDGMVWIGSSEGLYRFDTKVEKNYDLGFHTLIRKVTIANDSVVFYGTNYIVNEDQAEAFQRLAGLQQPEDLKPVLKYAENSISFDFAAPSFEDETANRFSYYLEGYDKRWSAWSEKAEKEYTNLPYGDYTFKVKAKNTYDVEGATALYAFSILPPWYFTYWAYALYLIAFLFLMYSGIKLFNRRLQAQNIRLEKEKAQQQEFSSQLIASQENERKRIAAELHDGINQSLVLIKNKLYMMLNPKLDKDAMEDRIKTLTEDVGNTMDEVRGVSYGLRPFQLDQLGLSKSLEALAGDASEATGIAFDVDIDTIDDLFPKDQQINVYRIVQECINNMIKHAAASEASLSVKSHKKEVEIRIQDNGKGFDTKKTSLKSKSGFGMMGIRERIRSLGGSLHIVSNLGKGSIFSITLTIKNT